MNARVLKLGVLAAIVLALSACAGTPSRAEEPHHYSRDNRGNRIACYATEAANEYECVPAGYPRRAYAYDPFWDPYPVWPWVSLGFYYGWPHYSYGYPVRAHPGPWRVRPPARRR